MERRMLKNKIISVLLLVVILAADFNFLPVQSIINQASQSTAIVAYAATTKAGKWIKESNGKWWYKHTDGTYTKNDWEYINGYWYHFDSSGYMQTGWLKVDGKWYHLNSEGKMHIGWVKIGNYWYHFDSNGVRQTGWQKLNGNWYYFNSDGIRQVGWQKVDGKWYHLNSEGIMETGWVKIGNYWYHFDSTGVRQTGWQKLNGNWYYFNSDGIRQVGWQQVDGKWYHLNSEGIMEIGWVKIGTDWYFFHSTGERYVGWLTENGKTYHFNSSGIMDIGWKKINNYWYHFNSSGVMNTSTLTEGTRKYFFDNSAGVLYSTELIVDEEKQQKENWCWAACAVMVGTYNTNYTSTQNAVVGATHFYSEADVAEVDSVVVKGMNFASRNTKSGIITSPLSFNEAVAQIDKNHPFMIHLSPLDGSTGHMVVCTGYKKRNENEYVLIVDPDPTMPTVYYGYKNLCNINSEYNKYRVCTSMIIY